MRQSASLSCEAESITATSHSSLAQTSPRHQSPEVRHGPEAQTILPRTLPDEFARVLMRVGCPRIVCTSARHGGRKTLKPIIGSAGILPALSAKREPVFMFRFVV